MSLRIAYCRVLKIIHLWVIHEIPLGAGQVQHDQADCLVDRGVPRRGRQRYHTTSQH
jgi:hypothetical protein